MTTLVLGDTHGRDYWKQIVDKENFDRIVFIGDYFDSFDITGGKQVDNFLDIIEYKKTSGKEVILLVGNHDYHYMPGVQETYSGFQHTNCMIIARIIEQNFDHLQMCYQYNNILMSHAGVTTNWLKNSAYEGEANIADYINNLFYHHPFAFCFTGYDPYGDDITQSPIWVRPKSLLKDAFKFGKLTQIVGHTGMKKIDAYKYRYWFIDTLGTSKEYLKIEEVKPGFEIFMIEKL